MYYCHIKLFKFTIQVDSALCVRRKLASLYGNHRLTSVLKLTVQFTAVIFSIFGVFEWKRLTQLPLAASCQHGKLPGAALNPCLIDNNYRQNPLHYRAAAQRSLSVAQSETQDSYRGYKCTNRTPNSPSC